MSPSVSAGSTASTSISAAAATPSRTRSCQRLNAAEHGGSTSGKATSPFVVMADPEGNEFCVLAQRDVYEHTGPVVSIVIKTLDPTTLASFWSAATGWDVVVSTSGYAALQDRRGTGPLLELIATNEPHRVKSRWHLDVRPDASADRDAEVERLLGLGATRVEIGQSNAAPGEVTLVVLADPEENEFCVLRGIDEPRLLSTT